MRKKHRWILPVLAILVILTLIALDERLILRTYTVASPKLTAEVRLAVVTDFHSSDNADDVAAMVASMCPATTRRGRARWTRSISRRRKQG